MEAFTGRAQISLIFNLYTYHFSQPQARKVAMVNWYLRLVGFLVMGANVAHSLLVVTSSAMVRLEQDCRYLVAVIGTAYTGHSTCVAATRTAGLVVMAHSKLDK